MSFCLYNKKNITGRLEDMNFIFSWQKQYFTNELRSFVKYCFAARNKIHIFAPPCNILYLFYFYFFPVSTFPAYKYSFVVPPSQMILTIQALCVFS